MILDVYVDGSYFTRKPNVTSGGVVIVKNTDTPFEQVLLVRHVNTERVEFVSANNAGGELIAALTGIMDACNLCSADPGKSIVNIYYDYKGVKEFISGGYAARKQGPILYVGSVSKVLELNPRVELKFHKVKAHSGDKYNELADTIAKGVIPSMYDSVKTDTITI